MSDFKIISDVGSYEMSEDNMYGQIFVHIDECYFPFDDWGDLILSMMEMWTWNTKEIAQSPVGHEETFCFMDGPYRMQIKKKSKTSLNVTLYTEFPLNRIRRNISVELGTLLREVHRVTGQVITFAHQRVQEYPKLLSNRISKLEKGNDVIENLIATYSNNPIF